MLGKRDPQRSFTGAIAQLGMEVVLTMGFYGKLGLNSFKIFKDEDFASCYSKFGRPSAPPSMLAIATLLQIHDRVSDDETIQRLRFDMRWKVALDLELYSIEAPFVKSTFQAFRVRLATHAKDAMVFENTVRLACDNGLLPHELLVALDSTPVRSKGALKDAFNLLSDAIAAVIRMVAKKKRMKAEDLATQEDLERHIQGPSIKGSELVDWDDEGSVGTFLRGILDDGKKVIAIADENECASDEVDLLKKVIEQEIEKDEESGYPKIKDGVAKGRVCSATDPEMRHGRKSSGKTYTGHKGHVAVEVSSGFITAIGITEPGVSDGSQYTNLINQTEENTGSLVVGSLGDTAYSSDATISQAQEAGVDHTTKMRSHPKGKFGPGDFKLNEDGSEAQCPAGHSSGTTRFWKTGIFHAWSTELCGDCPFKDKCTEASFRTMRIRPTFLDRRQRERFAKSKAGRELLRLRVAVEHAIGRMKNLGAGTARYFGKPKTGAQLFWTAAVANLSLIFGKLSDLSC